jgi:hypothetical protein
MSDLINLIELLAVADDETGTTPPLPAVPQRRAIREACGVPLIQVAAAVGVSSPTAYRAETLERKMSSSRHDRRYRRVIDAMRRRVEQRDPHALEVA